MDTTFARFESARLLSLGYLARTYLTGRREPFTNLKDLQNVIRNKWHDADEQTVRKAILQWKRHLAAVAKQNGGPIQHLMALFPVRKNPRWRPPPSWKHFKWPYLRNRSSDPLDVWFQRGVFRDGGSNGAISGSKNPRWRPVYLPSETTSYHITVDA